MENMNGNTIQALANTLVETRAAQELENLKMSDFNYLKLL